MKLWIKVLSMLGFKKVLMYCYSRGYGDCLDLAYLKNKYHYTITDTDVADREFKSARERMFK